MRIYANDMKASHIHTISRKPETESEWQQIQREWGHHLARRTHGKSSQLLAHINLNKFHLYE